MNTKKLLQLMGIVLTTLLLAGCGAASPEPMATPTQFPQPPTATAETSGDFQPLSAAACGDLADTMAQALGVTVTTAETPFQDYINGEAGIGCQMTATGTGLDFESYTVVANTMRETLESQGWEADFMYAADGPTGTGNGFRQGNALCLFSVGWEPSEDADCPSDQPISACELAPGQMLYTIMLNCAQEK